MLQFHLLHFDASKVYIQCVCVCAHSQVKEKRDGFYDRADTVISIRI